jgi:hypothetical protein
MTTHANRLLQAIDRVTNGDPLHDSPLIVVSAAAKMPNLGEALHAAILLEAAGFVRLERSNILEDNRLRLTVTGVAEAWRLGLPFWKRWATDTSLVKQLALLCIGAVFGVASSIVVKVLLP